MFDRILNTLLLIFRSGIKIVFVFMFATITGQLHSSIIIPYNIVIIFAQKMSQSNQNLQAKFSFMSCLFKTPFKIVPFCLFEKFQKSFAIIFIVKRFKSFSATLYINLFIHFKILFIASIRILIYMIEILLFR